jgi:hypothetical protein
VKLIPYVILSSAAALLLSQSSAAAVISHDWKTPGDGLLTYDTVNKREWLDLTKTILNSQFPGANRDQKYQFVVSQTVTGGLFDGFMVAKSADVTSFAQSAGIDTSTEQYAANATPTANLNQLIGTTVTTLLSNYSVGLLNEYTAGLNPHQLGAEIATVTTSWAGLRIGWNDEPFVSPPPGVFLFREVPEPEGLVQILCAGAVLAFGIRNPIRTSLTSNG